MAPTASKKFPDTELGNPDALLAGGMEAVRPTKGAAGRGWFRKRKLAGNRQDRGECPGLKGR